LYTAPTLGRPQQEPWNTYFNNMVLSGAASTTPSIKNLNGADPSKPRYYGLNSQDILGTPGRAATDRAKGQHPDVVVDGERAFIYYFVHQKNEAEAAADPRWNQRTVIQVAELVYKDGRLVVDRDAPLRFRLHAPSP
jgi:hypothetical protein